MIRQCASRLVATASVRRSVRPRLIGRRAGEDGKQHAGSARLRTSPSLPYGKEQQTMDIQKTDTAIVFIDPQNDVLSEKGANWGAVGASVTENRTVENMERIFKAAKANGYELFISPHYFYPTDTGWKLNGPLETDEFRTHSFARSGPLNLAGFPNSGADWLDRFKPYIEDGRTIVVSPHKGSGPQTNDLVLQLRKRAVRRIILRGK